MSDVNMRRMHCPQSNEQISPLRAVFGFAKHAFDCSRCGIELVIAPMNAVLLPPALLALAWANAEYGHSRETLTVFVMLTLMIVIAQLLLTPVRRYIPL
jgi:hypothetical protein